jgi:hypothetical protein
METRDGGKKGTDESQEDARTSIADFLGERRDIVNWNVPDTQSASLWRQRRQVKKMDAEVWCVLGGKGEAEKAFKEMEKQRLKDEKKAKQQSTATEERDKGEKTNQKFGLK